MQAPQRTEPQDSFAPQAPSPGARRGTRRFTLASVNKPNDNMLAAAQLRRGRSRDGESWTESGSTEAQSEANEAVGRGEGRTNPPRRGHENPEFPAFALGAAVQFRQGGVGASPVLAPSPLLESPLLSRLIQEAPLVESTPVTFELAGTHLGEIRVSMTPSDQGVKIVLIFASPSTRREADRSTPELLKRLRSRGVRVAGLELGIRDSESEESENRLVG